MTSAWASSKSHAARSALRPDMMAVAAFACLLVAACTRASDDPRPPVMRIGERHAFKVPRAYLQANAGSSATEINDVPAIFVVGTAPDFQPRSAANAAVFGQGGSDPLIRAYLSPVYNKTPESAVAALRSRLLESPPIETKQLSPTETRLALEPWFRAPGEIEDIYLSTSGRFTVCGRPGSVPSPNCDIKVATNEGVLTITIGLKWVERRHEIAELVSKRFAQWHISSEGKQ